MVRLLSKVLFVLWCLSWLPTIVILLTENPSVPEDPGLTALKLICLLNVLAYYVGGLVWLRPKSGPGIVASWFALAFVLFMLSSFGPVSLAGLKSMLRPVRGRPDGSSDGITPEATGS
jgi:hypothetical protein